MCEMLFIIDIYFVLFKISFIYRFYFWKLMLLKVVMFIICRLVFFVLKLFLSFIVCFIWLWLVVFGKDCLGEK